MLILRLEDLDRDRCRAEFRSAIEEDLRWFGFDWQEEYVQSARDYLPIWRRLRDSGFIYPCACSRRDVLAALSAPHGEEHAVRLDDEPLYPGTCRGRRAAAFNSPAGVNWRFRVPEGREICFEDGRLGRCSATAGRDFGDFVVWRKDNIPAYQLAVVADDAAMQVTEVVRGEDLLTSTFRQLLLYEALGLEAPGWYHCPLVVDAGGKRLAKRDVALSLRALRAEGVTPEELRERVGRFF